MTHIGYGNICRTEFYTIVSGKDTLENKNLNQLKLKVDDTHKKDEKITTNFETSKDKDDINKTFTDTTLSKTEGHISFKEKNYKEYKVCNAQNSERFFDRKSCEYDSSKTL